MTNPIPGSKEFIQLQAEKANIKMPYNITWTQNDTVSTYAVDANNKTTFLNTKPLEFASQSFIPKGFYNT